jgi:transposase-like protein
MATHGKKQRRRLSAEEKWNIYQECEKPGIKIGEVLRKHGLYSSDLQLIRRDIKEAAMERLSQSKPGRKKSKVVPVEERDRLKKELEEKEKALVELSVMFTTLKKKVNLE